MKKFIMYLAGVMLVLSLAACTPTRVEPEETTIPPEYQESTGGASDKVPDPNVEPMDVVSIYSVNGDASGLNQAMDAVEKLDAQALVDKLIEYGVLAEGTKVLSFDMKEGVGTLDLSELPGEEKIKGNLLFTAIGNTFIENFDLEKLKLMVDGQEYTGTSSEQASGGYLEFVLEFRKF